VGRLDMDSRGLVLVQEIMYKRGGELGHRNRNREVVRRESKDQNKISHRLAFFQMINVLVIFYLRLLNFRGLRRCCSPMTGG
jgi:hypothetical protein